MAEEALEDVNREALTAYQTITDPAVLDWGLVPYMLEALTDGLSGEDRLDLMARLSLIRAELTPPPDADHG